METVIVPAQPFSQLAISATTSTLPEPAALALWGCVLLAGAALLRHRERPPNRRRHDLTLRGRAGIAIGRATMAEAV